MPDGLNQSLIGTAIGRYRELTVMILNRRLLLGLAATALLATTELPSPAAAAGKIRIAFGDIATVETLNFLIAVERAKERGVDIEVTYFKSEDIAAQAVVGGQADVGVGAPYTVLQKVKAPIRIFYQMSTLRFFPVVNTEFYQDWKDLNGQEIAVHSRGSGTEAIMQLMAKRHGIEYSNISYVPGSEVRATALLQGHVKATIVDSTNWRIIQDKGGDKFKLLAIENVDATDEALYANTVLPRSASRRRSTSWSRSWSGPGVRSTRTRLRWSSCAPSTTSCRTCPTISRPRSCPISRGRSPAGCSRTMAAAPRRPRPTSSSMPLPASWRAIRPAWWSRSSGSWGR